jgi:ribosome-binding protein aMBF1 (putative translation factor)
MNISIDIPFLIDRAKQVSGKSFGDMARELNRSQTRISEWKANKAKPDASEIAYFADQANLPILETVATIEQVIRPAFYATWQKALEQGRNL